MRVHASDRVLDRHKDGRGFFEELYSQARPEYDSDTSWRQVNHSVSRIHVLRGIHVAPYAKLVSCLIGHIYDVVVDTRPTSPTYGQWDAVDLCGDNGRQVYVPAGCGHAFVSLAEGSHVVYLQGGVYDPARELSLYWKSPAFDIMWPIESPMLSPKDSGAKLLQELPPPAKPWWKRWIAAIRSSSPS